MYSNELVWSIQNLFLLSSQGYYIDSASGLYIAQQLLFAFMLSISDSNEPLCSVLLLDWSHFSPTLKSSSSRSVGFELYYGGILRDFC